MPSTTLTVSATLYAPSQPDMNNNRTEVAFVLDNVADWQTLVAGVRKGVEVVVLDGRGNGLAQMADWLAQKSPGSVDAIHLLGHGSSGALNLGALTLTGSNLSDHTHMLAQIAGALTEEGDWLLYGCNVGEGQTGAKFVGALRQVTGADIAASVDLTGASNLKGDWLLEESAGSIQIDPLKIESFRALL